MMNRNTLTAASMCLENVIPGFDSMSLEEQAERLRECLDVELTVNAVDDDRAFVWYRDEGNECGIWIDTLEKIDDFTFIDLLFGDASE